VGNGIRPDNNDSKFWACALPMVERPFTRFDTIVYRKYDYVFNARNFWACICIVIAGRVKPERMRTGWRRLRRSNFRISIAISNWGSNDGGELKSRLKLIALRVVRLVQVVAEKFNCRGNWKAMIRSATSIAAN